MMPKKLLLTYCLTIILTFLVYSGCSGNNRPKELPRLFPVTLTITLDDQPLGDANVLLCAENEADVKWTIGGWTNADGEVTIGTQGQFSGSPSGKFKVCVVKSEVIKKDQDTPATVVDCVDRLFANPKSTPLEIEVSPKGATNLTLSVHKPQK